MTPRPSPRHHLHGAVELRAAIAALRAEHVAREALRVHANEDAGLAGHLAEHQRDVLRLVHVVLVADDGELAEVGRDPRLGDAVDQLLGLEPVGHELGDRDEREVVLLRDRLQLRTPRHRAVGVEDLADDAGGHEPGEPRQVHAGLGLPYPLQHAARASAQREDVARPPEIGRHGGGIDGDVDRGGAVGGGDTGRDAEAALRVDAHREGGRELLGVPIGHLRQAQLVAALAR